MAFSVTLYRLSQFGVARVFPSWYAMCAEMPSWGGPERPNPPKFALLENLSMISEMFLEFFHRPSKFELRLRR
jgi:hypothetical protein